jgi:hypothetical protein
VQHGGSLRQTHTDDCCYQLAFLSLLMHDQLWLATRLEPLFACSEHDEAMRM